MRAVRIFLGFVVGRWCHYNGSNFLISSLVVNIYIYTREFCSRPRHLGHADLKLKQSSEIPDRNSDLLAWNIALEHNTPTRAGILWSLFG